MSSTLWAGGRFFYPGAGGGGEDHRGERGP